ncbi:ABC transporter G family member 11, partial [Mucuna pruriens]
MVFKGLLLHPSISLVVKSFNFSMIFVFFLLGRQYILVLPLMQISAVFCFKWFSLPLYNPSDHYLRIINKDFNQAVDERTTEEATDILVSSYKSSEIRNHVDNEVAKISESDSGEGGKKKIHAAFLTQCLVLIKRSSLQIYRDISNYWLHLIVFIAIAISMGSIFYHVDSSNTHTQDRGSLITFFITVLTFMTLVGGFPPLIEEMKFHFTALYMCTPAAVDFYIQIYHLSGLHKGAEHFLYFASVICGTVMWVESLMLVLASIFPNYVAGLIFASGIEGLMILTCGFNRRPNDLPKPLWKYPFYYVSFLTYALQGSFKNEFEGLSFTLDIQDGGAKTINGTEILANTWHVQMGHSKWVDLVIMSRMIVLYRVLFLAIAKTTEKLKPVVKARSQTPSIHHQPSV